jgi:hypothetical protein
LDQRSLHPRFADNPDHIIDYGAIYDATSDQIMGLLQEAKGSGSSSKLVADALDLIGMLRDQVKGYRAELDKVKADLDSYATKVSADHDALAGSNDAIANLISVENTQIENFRTRINALHDEIDAWNKQIMDAQIGTGLSIFVACIGAVVAFVPGGQTVGIGMIVVGAGGVAASAADIGTALQTLNIGASLKEWPMLCEMAQRYRPGPIPPAPPGFTA